MKLLIVTQKVDRNDPVLGFFHRWIEMFAQQSEQVHVICLFEGAHALPQNVRVYSLGKSARGGPASGWEKVKIRLGYIWWFVRYIVQLRRDYDAVFVHMNQEYVLLGGIIWKLFGKKILLWRNHAYGNWFTYLSVGLANRVFCTSPHSFTARFKKTALMPVGIDTGFFQPNSSIAKEPNSILFLGRMAPVKNVALFVEALRILNENGVHFAVTIAGDAVGENTAYETEIRENVKRYGLESKVKFVGAVSQEGALELYRSHDLYVNLTPSGSMDKTIFEAMATGTLTLVANEFFKEMLSPECLAVDLNQQTIADNLATILNRGVSSYHYLVKSNMDYVVSSHSLHETVRQVLISFK